jgi:hypothetical protein
LAQSQRRASSRPLNHLPRHTDGAGVGKLLEPCRYVHALAKPIIALDDHFAEIDADANIDPLVFGQIGIALDETSLKRDGAFDRVNNASKFRKEAIAVNLKTRP